MGTEVLWEKLDKLSYLSPQNLYGQSFVSNLDLRGEGSATDRYIHGTAGKNERYFNLSFVLRSKTIPLR